MQSLSTGGESAPNTSHAEQWSVLDTAGAQLDSAFHYISEIESSQGGIESTWENADAATQRRIRLTRSICSAFFLQTTSFRAAQPVVIQ